MLRISEESMTDVILLNSLQRENIISQHADNITNEFESLFDNIESFATGLNLSAVSPLTPRERFSESESIYQSTIAGARAGDIVALAALPQAAQEFLNESSNFFSGTFGFSSRFDMVQNDLSDILSRESEISFDPVVASIEQVGRQSVINTTDMIEKLNDVILAFNALADDDVDITLVQSAA